MQPRGKKFGALSSPTAVLPKPCSLLNKPYQQSSYKISRSRGSAPNEPDGKRAGLQGGSSLLPPARSPRGAPAPTRVTPSTPGCTNTVQGARARTFIAVAQLRAGAGRENPQPARRRQGETPRGSSSPKLRQQQKNYSQCRGGCGSTGTRGIQPTRQS